MGANGVQRCGGGTLGGDVLQSVGARGGDLGTTVIFVRGFFGRGKPFSNSFFTFADKKGGRAAVGTAGEQAGGRKTIQQKSLGKCTADWAAVGSAFQNRMGH